eukprot:1995506-Rhodomonas_salina.1
MGAVVQDGTQGADGIFGTAIYLLKGFDHADDAKTMIIVVRMMVAVVMVMDDCDNLRRGERAE